MSNESYNVSQAIFKFITTKNPYPVHIDDLTESLLPIYHYEDFNESIDNLLKVKFIRRVGQMYVLYNNDTYPENP